MLKHLEGYRNSIYLAFKKYMCKHKHTHFINVNRKIFFIKIKILQIKFSLRTSACSVGLLYILLNFFSMHFNKFRCTHRKCIKSFYQK